MSGRALADTSVFIADEAGRPLDHRELPDELAISVITVGELRAGVLAANDLATREQRLRTLTAVMSITPVPIDAAVADRWAHLRVLLRDAGRSMGVNDSWIAATAMALGVPLVTQDAGIPAVEGLDVLRV